MNKREKKKKRERRKVGWGTRRENERGNGGGGGGGDERSEVNTYFFLKPCSKSNLPYLERRKKATITLLGNCRTGNLEPVRNKFVQKK